MLELNPGPLQERRTLLAPDHLSSPICSFFLHCINIAETVQGHEDLLSVFFEKLQCVEFTSRVYGLFPAKWG